jgi:phosphonate transport system substrate-binding protein
LGDARASLLNAYSDVAQVVKIIRLSDLIPYEPLVFRRELPVEVQDKLLAAFVGLAESEEGLSLLSDLCSATGLVPASDRDYEPVRRMARSLGLDYEQLAQMR